MTKQPATMTPEAFRAWRARLTLTQAEAADALGVSKRTVEQWEGGQNPIAHMVLLATRWIEEHKDVLIKDAVWRFEARIAAPGKPGTHRRFYVAIDDLDLATRAVENLYPNTSIRGPKRLTAEETDAALGYWPLPGSVVEVD